MKKETNKTKWLHVRLTEEDYKLISNRFNHTTCRKLSEYVRKKLLDKQLNVVHRNASLDDFLTELSRVKTELNHIGNNFNQAVRKLNSMQPSDNIQLWLTIYEQDRQAVIKMLDKVDHNIIKITDQWLQNSRPDHL